MKTTKRILAIVLAALMLAAMIPFAVSAAGDTYTLNVKSSKEGFNFEVIKVADINTETGAYTSEYAGVVDALNKGGITGAKAVLAICDNIKWNELDYVPAGKWTDGTDTGVKPITGLAAGVYYIKSEATDKAPAGSKVQNRIIPIPYYENNAWVPAVENGVGVYPETIDLASKAEIVPKVSKKILDGDDTVNGLYDVTAIGQDVTFELTADVTGSVEASEDNILTGKLSRYAITDTYEKGLTFKPGTVEVKFVNDTTTTSTTDFKVEEGLKFNGPIDKFLREGDREELAKRAELEVGDVLYFIADNKKNAEKFAGQIRNEVASRMGLIDENKFEICWIVDFPMYEEDEETGKPIFTHNPFSMPQGELEALNTKDPCDVLAYQYDVVCNGVELASGAVRNHDIDVMVKAFDIAGYTEEDVAAKFGALYSAFKFGAPPHAGMAFGIDRMIMLLLDEESIREVIAFPLNSNAQDLLLGAPTEVTEQQLREVHIKVRQRPQDIKTNTEQ